MRGAFAGLLLSGVALAGCGNLLGIGDFHLAGDASPAGDGGADAPDDSAGIDSNADAQLCYGTSLITACFATVPTGTVDLSNTLNTTSDSRCATLTNMPTGGTPCVIAAATITVGAGAGKLLVTGSRPLVLVATDTITVQGTLDASSSRSASRTGPGANSDQCLPAEPGVPSNTGPGGGGGGGFGTPGGRGGNGGNAQGGLGGSPRPPDYVRGGCAGAIGGQGGSLPGDGGAGGGAVYLIAGTKITTMREIFASGAAGSGPLLRAGGGGGGSGGLIGLEAPMVVVQNIVAANGGGGGGGAGTTAGKNGTDGTTNLFTQPAQGGTAGNGGSAGGNGGYIGSNMGGNAPNASLYGGGGGGGGVGWIWIKGQLSGNGGFSPAPTMAP